MGIKAATNTMLSMKAEPTPVISMMSGVRTKRFVPNVDLADAVFVFDKAKHPGVEVNDLR